MFLKYSLLIFLLFLVFLNAKNNDNVIRPIAEEKHTPETKAIKPEIEELTQNIFYDNFNQCLKLGKKYNRNLIIVFSADWCVYCNVLKKDAYRIKQFNKYIVCFVDIQQEQNQTIINTYKPKNLPTSLILDIITNKVISQKVGYNGKDYSKWLESL
jgi:thioredoxin-related protein